MLTSLLAGGLMYKYHWDKVKSKSTQSTSSPMMLKLYVTFFTAYQRFPSQALTPHRLAQVSEYACHKYP
jgi:hypothetical protein